MDACLAAPPPAALGGQRLVYLHLMKTGGLSVDALLRCRCLSAETPCALLRDDGGAKKVQNTSGDLIAHFKESLLLGTAACGGGPLCTAAGLPLLGPAAVRLSREEKHAQPRDRTHEKQLEAAGSSCAAQLFATHETFHEVRARPYWASARYVTVLREPAARVFSFYLYVRRKSAYFRNEPLLGLLRRWPDFRPNASIASPHHHYQLSNMMALALGRRRSDALGFGEQQRELALRPSSPAARGLLRRATEALSQMELVGLTEDLPGFERALAARWPAFFGRGGCAIPAGQAAQNTAARHAFVSAREQQAKEAGRPFSWADAVREWAAMPPVEQQADFAAQHAGLGPPGTRPPTSRSPSRGGGHAAAASASTQLDEATRRAVLELNAADAELYARARELFGRQPGQPRQAVEALYGA